MPWDVTVAVSVVVAVASEVGLPSEAVRLVQPAKIMKKATRTLRRRRRLVTTGCRAEVRNSGSVEILRN
jgi:hypothetical protein